MDTYPIGTEAIDNGDDRWVKEEEYVWECKTDFVNPRTLEELRRDFGPIRITHEVQDDVISQPSHYTSHKSGIEPIQIAKHETFLRGNIIKYVMRAPFKGNELQDLQKARQYLDWEIERIEKESGL